MTMTEDRNQPETNPDEFNGWPNRETWAASLHLSNDFGLYEMVNQWAEDARAEAVEEAYADVHDWYARKIATIGKTTVRELADKLSGYFDDLCDDMAVDGAYLSETERMMVLEVGSVWRVDWFHLAENWLSGFEFENDDS